MYNRLCTYMSGRKPVCLLRGTNVFNKIFFQFFLIMKLTGILLLVFSMHVSAFTFAQRITLRVTNSPLEHVLKQIQQQSGYNFMFNNQYLKKTKPVTLDIRNLDVKDALQLLFKNQPYDYRIEGEIVTLISKSQAEPTAPLKFEQLQQQIGGRVTDSLDTPLPGVSVLVKGTSRGTSTDENGNYQIQANVGEALVFRNVGYVLKEIVVGQQTALDVVLQVEASGLEEVVVVGYGTQKKETVTGAVASVSTKEIKQSPAANLAVTLAGRLPGLTTVQQSGEPGRDLTSLYLRGQRTLNGQAPLILVDGVPRELTYIDPNEVQTVTILKDASATAVFGVRGANGVILVTTRRGTSEKPEISFSSETGVQQFNRLPDPVGSLEYAELSNQAMMNDGFPAFSKFSQQSIEHYRSQDRPDIYPDNDWMDILTRDNTMQQRLNLNVSGQAKAMRYFVNVGALTQNGLWKTAQKEYDASSSLKRYNFRSNIDLDLNKSLHAFLNVAGYLEMKNAPNPNYGTDQLLYYSYIYPATMAGPLTPDGQVLTTLSESRPPWALINRSGYRQEKNVNVTATYGMEQKLDFITEGLSAKVMASFDVQTIYRVDARQTYQQWVMDLVLDENGVEQPKYSRRDQEENTPLSLSSGSSFMSYFNLQGFLNYNRTFGDHTVTGLLLYQQDEQILNGDRLPFRIMGASSRLTYGYKSKYFAEFNAGYNGSEQFSRGNRFGFFPSISGSWIVTREDFLNTNNVLTLLKLRASYGRVGNDRLGGARFLYLDNISLGGGGYNPSLYNGQQIDEVLIGNPKLRWEVSQKTNLGIEVGLFDQLDVIVDVFKETTNNMLINRQQISQLFGLSGIPPVNTGIVKNRGYEIELRYRKNFKSDFGFLANLNFNYAKNNLVYNDEPRRTEGYAYRYRQQGFAIGQQFGYLTDGFWNSQEEIDQSGLSYQIGRGQPRPGDLKYRDINGDQVISEEDIAPILHSAVPQYTFGGSFSLNYKSFDISFLLQGVADVSKEYTGNGIFENAGGANVFFDIHRHAWTPERATSGEEISYPALGSSTNTNHVTNQFFIWDASYLRLKNVEVGYTLPSPVLSKLRLQNLRVYANALNPITWDRLPTKAYDPEISWVLAYPIQRVFNFGINVIF